MSHVHIGLYDALREVGASEETARAGAVDIPVGQNLATKEDLLQAIAGVNDRIAAANDRIGKVETGIAALRGEVKAGIADLRGEVNTEIAAVKTEIANFRSALYRAALLMAVSIVTVIVGILKLLP